MSEWRTNRDGQHFRKPTFSVAEIAEIRNQMAKFPRHYAEHHPYKWPEHCEMCKLQTGRKCPCGQPANESGYCEMHESGEITF